MSRSQQTDLYNAGQRSLMHYIDQKAATNGDAIAIHQVFSGSDSKNVDLSYHDLSLLINSFSWWLHDILDKSSKDNCIAYLGPSDLRHLLISLAAVRIKSKALLLSPRNSVEAHAHLLKQCSSNILIHDPSFQDLATKLTDITRLQTHSISALKDVLETTDSHDAYDWHESWDALKDQTALILHTSGSTGLPKPVQITHSAIAAIDAQRLISRRSADKKKCQLEILAEAERPYHSFPLFHVAGFGLLSFLLMGGKTVVLGAPSRPPSTHVFNDVLQTGKCDAALLPPQVLADISKNQALLSNGVGKLKWLFFGGGSLDKAAGDTLCNHTRLLNGMGTTECGSYVQYPTEKPYWNCYHFHPLGGIQWRPADDGDEANQEYELIFKKNQTTIQYQAVFHNFPELTEFATKDIFYKHPERPEYWVYVARQDDIIALSTGEKINPVGMERSISSLPGVNAALVVGDKRPHPALLLEVDSREAEGQARDVKRRVEEKIDVENKHSSRDGQIGSEDIIFADPNKPFPRNMKGAVHRNNTAKEYQETIDNHFQKTENESSDQSRISVPLNLSSHAELASSLTKSVGQLLDCDSLGADDDFFNAGLDSRHVQILSSFLRGQLKDKIPEKIEQIGSDAIYSSPTATQLAGFLFHLLEGNGYLQPQSDSFEDIYSKYAERLQSLSPRKNSSDDSTPDSDHILVVGSSGFVGSYLVDALFNRRSVNRITCLDRPSPHRHADAAPKTWTRRYSHDGTYKTISVQHMIGNLGSGKFDLDESVFEDLLSTVTLVLHCQWPVNFSMSLASFAPHLEGMTNLIQFANQSQHNCRVVFLSSIATVKNWDRDFPVPEEALSNPKYAQTGYGQSKLLAGNLLEDAGKLAGVRSSICRLTQISGPVHKVIHDKTWPHRDWFPQLLDASSEMGCLPESLGSGNEIDWVPVDQLAEVLTDLVDNSLSPKVVDMQSGSVSGWTHYHNIASPHRARYEEHVLPVLCDQMRLSKTVPLADWISQLEKTETSDHPSSALSLLSFFKGLEASKSKPPVVLDTSVTEKQMYHLTGVGAVNSNAIKGWLNPLGVAPAYRN